MTEVRLCAPIDFGKWGSRYAAGEVADRLPYGFDQLECAGVRIAATTIGGPRRSIRGLARRSPQRANESFHLGGNRVPHLSLSRPSHLKKRR